MYNQSEPEALRIFDELGSTSIRHYRSQETILFQGEIPPAAFLVRKGYVSSYTINNAGDEQIIGFFAAGDVFPVEWLFERAPVALYYYRAFTDCELLSLQRMTLLDALESNLALSRELLKQFVSGFIGSTVHIHALEHSHAHEKLIKLFHYLVLRFGVVQPNKKETFLIPFLLTHAQIASMLGLTRETVAGETMKLKKTGALTYDRGTYTINLPVLLASIGSEEFDSLEL
jgi:CRP/FNR family transcriptional regulator